MAKRTNRDDELCNKKAIEKELLRVFAEIEKGFVDQQDRTDKQIDYWDCFNSKLNDNQYYNGNAGVYVPITHAAIDARKTRFVNQLFPKTGRYVDVTTVNGDIPHAEMALIENYVDKARLRTEVAPALLVNGDVEGQYNIYVSWTETTRHITSRVNKGVTVDGVEMPEFDEMDDIENEIIIEGRPCAEVINDSDVLVLPATSNSVEEALEAGGSGTILRRWSKGEIRNKIDSGEFDKDKAAYLLDAMTAQSRGKRDIKKRNLSVAGIQDNGDFVCGFETWVKLRVDGVWRLCRAYYGGDKTILGCKLNPYWCDLCPLLSVPVDKVSGVFKGVSKVAPVERIQYFANDIVNQGADSATYSMLPIIMTDPEKNPRINTMILDLAAIWQVDPTTTQFAKFPEIWQNAFNIVAQAKSEIFQVLGVNPAMIPQGTGGSSKRNQAEIANEQQVDILTTADAVTVLEQGIFTPMLQRFAEYDHQFRSDAVTIRAFGRMGLQAKMEVIEPIQSGNRYYFRWFGVEAARNAAQIQQQIAAMNVLRGIQPQYYPGKILDFTAVIESMVENAFGPRIAPLTFVDMKDKLSVDPMQEDALMDDGFPMPVSPLDDDMAHIQVHLPHAKETGDPSGNIRVHLLAHQQQMAQKAQAAQPSPEGQPGTPGGAGPGIAGVPRPGGQVAGPRLIKQPPGAIAPESLPAAGAIGMPRKF